MRWDTPPALPYYDPSITNWTSERIKPSIVEVEYFTIFGTNRIQRLTNYLAQFDCNDFDGLNGTLFVRYPEICWLPDTDYFTCVTGRFYGQWAGSLADFSKGDKAIMSGGYIAGLWSFTPWICGCGNTMTFKIELVRLYAPSTVIFLAPPVVQPSGPIVTPPTVPSSPPGVPQLNVYHLGPGFSHLRMEGSTNGGQSWSLLTNGVTGEDGVLTLQVTAGQPQLLIRGAETGP